MSIVFCNGNKIEARYDGKALVFDTETGEEYIIVSTLNQPDSLVISAVDSKIEELNFFGVKKLSRF